MAQDFEPPVVLIDFQGRIAAVLSIVRGGRWLEKGEAGLSNSFIE